MANSVVSRDGTVLGYETLGAGPPLLLVHGASADRTRWAPVAERLGRRYTVHRLDRRGRGLSTAEAGPYDLRREGEDIAAVAEAIGPGTYVVAHSYGALCTLEAALITESIGRIVLYEPPMPSPGLPVLESGVFERLTAVSDDPGLVLETFFRAALRLPEADVDAMKGTPIWQARLAAAHTITRELGEVQAFTADDRLAGIRVPVRLFAGTESPAYLAAAAASVAARIPGADVVPLHGQGHQAMDHDPDQFVAAVFAFGAG
ncbi:alpha/beta fold hydrolase [Amycolatopsis sp. NPDC059027]|uniref:alpha/beta fold hydrolase n=1 Tax=unclassified Amycolatopsis TaxID=2618356 RepID=UPI00367168F4